MWIRFFTLWGKHAEEELLSRVVAPPLRAGGSAAGSHRILSMSREISGLLTAPVLDPGVFLPWDPSSRGDGGLHPTLCPRPHSGGRGVHGGSSGPPRAHPDFSPGDCTGISELSTSSAGSRPEGEPVSAAPRPPPPTLVLCRKRRPRAVEGSEHAQSAGRGPATPGPWRLHGVCWRGQACTSGLGSLCWPLIPVLGQGAGRMCSGFRGPHLTWWDLGLAFPSFSGGHLKGQR